MRGRVNLPWRGAGGAVAADGGKKPGRHDATFPAAQANQAIERWKADYEKLKTPEQIAAYQRRARETFLNSIGGLPERTPLKPQVVGAVLRPGYRVEKIIFQSQPNHYATALLYLPDAPQFRPPHPAVLVLCGHGFLAKGSPTYQAVCAMLALHGMAALILDPIDQGERGQYLGRGGWPRVWGVPGHTSIGMGCILLGRNTAQFEIWDGMRAIDYLQLREEIDPHRIGCTGCSGGGTQTCYLAALDDRIRSAAPSCYLTSTARLMESHGPADSEQDLFGQLAYGPHEADLVLMRAPSPFLIRAATQDIFNVVGAWETFRCAKRIYTRLGFAERIDLLEEDAVHGYARAHREGAARWMSRWLLQKDQVISESEITLLTPAEYRCTPDGKVMSLPARDRRTT